jgi:hypothetical protein
MALQDINFEVERVKYWVLLVKTEREVYFTQDIIESYSTLQQEA